MEFFYSLGRSDVISGVSVYAKRPEGVKQHHPIISSFTHANLKKILNIKPDMVIGFSDIQKDIARDLIAEGIDVFISNQRSIEEIFRYLNTIGHMIGEADKTDQLLNRYEEKITQAKVIASQFHYRPKVYIEEWDEPRIGGISWFSELVEICGGSDIFRERSLQGTKASDRFIDDAEVVKENPDIILACWCGKKVDLPSIARRPLFESVSAVKNQLIIELSPEIFLQPGPALFEEGIDILLALFSKFNQTKNHTHL